MSQQQTLDVGLREHDLPPLWDGLVVVWRGWPLPPPAFVCPPGHPDVCTACGSLAPALVNRGDVARSSVITRELVEAADRKRAALPPSWRHKVDPLVWFRLFAFRCPDCQHDQVADQQTGELWHLDVTDYGATGPAARA